jgi:hypothetical protein
MVVPNRKLLPLKTVSSPFENGDATDLFTNFKNMLKRTKGRILLTMLVITGLAGTVNNTSLSTQERKLAVTRLKDSRGVLLNTIKGLSGAELDFRVSENSPSIRECFYHLVAAEKEAWQQLESAMKMPARPERRAELVRMDDAGVAKLSSTGQRCSPAEDWKDATAPWRSLGEAVNAFKALRVQELKYIKTTTSDLRNRFIQISHGWVDCYQYLFYIAGHSNFHLHQIQAILTHPLFPAN